MNRSLLGPLVSVANPWGPSVGRLAARFAPPDPPNASLRSQPAMDGQASYVAFCCVSCPLRWLSPWPLLCAGADRSGSRLLLPARCFLAALNCVQPLASDRLRACSSPEALEELGFGCLSLRSLLFLPSRLQTAPRGWARPS